MRWNRKTLWLSFAIFWISLVPSGLSLAGAGLVVSLQPGVAPGSVQVTLANTRDTPVWVLRWNTPFDTTPSANLFAVTRPAKGWPDDERLDYIGRLVKRGNPVASSYLRLNPGQQLSRDIPVGLFYNVPEFDQYRVEYTARLQYRTSDPAVATSRSAARADRRIEQDAGSLSMMLAPDDGVSARYRAPDYSSCSAGQSRQIEAALTVAEGMTSRSVRGLAGLAEGQRAASPRYALWFGAYAADRFETVGNTYLAINDALLNKPLSLDCGCDEQGVFAYVYPNRPYEVFLCPAFWAANPAGTDSRGGTLIHELSHFTAIAGTDDHVYGQASAQALARTNPELAVDNADSLEYFAENTPAVPISATDGAPQDPQEGPQDSGGAMPPDDDGMPPGTDEEGGAGPASITQLTPGVAINGRVEREALDAYQVIGAAQIELTYQEGDADLRVYADAQFSQPICITTTVEGPDVCAVDPESRVYLLVYGYRATDYRLLATLASDAEPAEGDPAVPLVPGEPVTGQVQERAMALYSIQGDATVKLESLTGDADLYVYVTATPMEDTLLCSSYATQPVDTCELTGLTGTAYVFVYGYRAADYTLLATRSASPGAGTGGAAGDDTGPGPDAGQEPDEGAPEDPGETDAGTEGTGDGAPGQPGTEPETPDGSNGEPGDTGSGDPQTDMTGMTDPDGAEPDDPVPGDAEPGAVQPVDPDADEAESPTGNPDPGVDEPTGSDPADTGSTSGGTEDMAADPPTPGPQTGSQTGPGTSPAPPPVAGPQIPADEPDGQDGAGAEPIGGEGAGDSAQNDSATGNDVDGDTDNGVGAAGWALVLPLAFLVLLRRRRYRLGSV